jgi:hypothetical protein
MKWISNPPLLHVSFAATAQLVLVNFVANALSLTRGFAKMLAVDYGKIKIETSGNFVSIV